MSDNDARLEKEIQQTLYQCPRCTVQWAGPETDELRICQCSNHPLRDEKRLEPIGTVTVEESGWTRLSPTAETLQKGFGVLYENDRRLQLEDNGVMREWDTKEEPVPGEIRGVEETRRGPRYEVCPDTDWWHPGREETGVPEDHVWHWEIVEVTERTRASVRLEVLRSERGEST